MIKLYVYVFSLFVFLSCNTNTKQLDNKKDSTDTIVSIQEVSDTEKDTKPSAESLSPYFVHDGKWVQIKNALTSDQTGMYLYFESENGVAKNLRLRIQYGNASNYIFNVGGTNYSYKANRSQSSNAAFVDGGMTWYDDTVKKDDLKFIETIIKSGKSVLSIGDNTITITNNTKQNLQKTLDYFEAQDGLLPRSNKVNIRRL